MQSKSYLVAYLLSVDNWDAVEHMDNWAFVYSRMPRKMRLVVDLKLTGADNKLVAKQMGCSVNSVCNHIVKAKKRFLRGENII